MTPQQINQLAKRYGLKLRDPNRPESGWVRSRPEVGHGPIALANPRAKQDGVEGFKHGGWTFEIDRGEEGDEYKLDETLDSEALLLGRRT